MRSRRFALLAILLCTSAAARAFAAASLTPLGDLPGGSFGSFASGVSADGSVVVGTSSSASGIEEAFRWTSAGGMVGLGDLPGGWFESVAQGVSGDGSVVVGLGYHGNSAIDTEAFRWTSGGGMVGLGDLPGGEFSSGAIGVIGDGSVIVGWSSSASGGEAFRWTSDGGMMGLGNLPGGVNGVSDDGSVFVGVVSSDSGYEAEAFRWTSDGGTMGLGKLPGGVGSEALGVNGDGSIVVGQNYDFNDMGPHHEAFYWTADGGMRELWDVLLSHGVDPAADGWTELSFASDITPDGITMVGWGTRNGNHDAFVAVLNVVELTGDYNNDGKVNAADYVVWRNSPGNFGGDPSGYNTWRANFGQSSGGRAAIRNNAVPEPATAVLALLAVSSTLLLRRRSLLRPNKLKVLRCQALAGALTLIAAAPAAAIDTEPLNNSQVTADNLSQLLSGTAVVNFARLDGAGNDVDFFHTSLAAGEVLIGMITPLVGLPSSFTPPDTVVGVFDETKERTFNEDDDAGELADIELGYGSVFRFLSPIASDYRIGVTGSLDYEFDGAASGGSHTENGGYVLTAGRVNPAVPGGGFTDTDPDNQTAAGADLIPATPGTARVAVAQLGDGDVDFFRLDLNAGDALSVMTAPLNDLDFSFNSPDTLIGLFDSSGTNLLVANDDSGGFSLLFHQDPETGEFMRVGPDLSSDFPGDQFAGLASALRAYIPADGTYYLAVTGYGDDGFVGAHFETGAYALLVGVAVPEPGGAILAALALVPYGLRRFVKPNRVRHAFDASCKSARNACPTPVSPSPVFAVPW